MTGTRSKVRRARVPKGHWQDPKNRKKALRALIERLGIEPSEVNTTLLTRHGYISLLHNVPGRSVEALLKEAGYDVQKNDRRTSKGIYNTPKKRVELVRNLMRKLGKKGTGPTMSELQKAGLVNMLYHCGGLKALWKECGLDLGTAALEQKRMLGTASGRRSLVERALRKLGKGPSEVTEADLKSQGLGRLLVLYRSIPKTERINIIMRDLGLLGPPIPRDELGLRPKFMPGRFTGLSRSERLHALRAFAARLGIPPSELTSYDLIDAGLTGLISYGKEAPGSLGKALEEAGAKKRPARTGR